MVQETRSYMVNDEPRSIIVENLDEIANAHQCKSTDLLMDLKCEQIRMSEQMIHMAACFQELNATIDENTKSQNETMRDIKKILSRHDTEITELKHNCRFPEYWEAAWKRLKILEDDYQRRQGGQKWDDRIYDIIKYLVCAVLGAILVWFIGGGHIS